MSVSAWCVAAYLGGALVIVMSDSADSWRWDELLILAGWPVLLPVGRVVLWWRRRRRTCRVCGLRYASRQIAQDRERHSCAARVAATGPVGSGTGEQP